MPLLVIVALILVAELLLQLIAPGLHDPTFFNVQGTFTDRPDLREDPKLFWIPLDRFAGVTAQLEQTPPADCIVFFGGSIVYGWPRPDNGSYPEFLQERLAADPQRAGLKVVNYAFPGYSSHQSSLLAEEILSDHDVKLVAVSHATNDARRMSFTDREAAKINGRIAKRLLYRFNKSKIFTIYRRFILGFVKSEKPIWDETGAGGKPRVSPTEFRENMLRYINAVSAQNARLVMISHVDNNPAFRAGQDNYFRVMEELAQNYDNVAYIDLRPEFQKLFDTPEPDYMNAEDPSLRLLVDHCHLTKQGNRLVAEILYRELNKLGWLD